MNSFRAKVLLIFLISLTSLSLVPLARAQTAGLPPPSPSSVKIFNGISNCVAYPGATIAEQINNCNADALTLSNGNTSGIIDLRGLGNSNFFDTQIFIGNTSGTAVTAIMPANGTWKPSNTFSSSSLCGLRIGKNVTILGSNAGANNGFDIVIPGSYTGTGLYAAICTDNTIAGYLKIVGIDAECEGPVNASGHCVDIEQTFDNLDIEEVTVLDHSAEIAFYTKDICCASTIKNLNANCNYTAGCTPMYMDSPVSGPGSQEVKLISPSLDHPGAGQHALVISDTRNPGATSVDVDGLYSEMSNSDTTTSAAYVNGTQGVSFEKPYCNYEDTVSTAACVEFNYGSAVPNGIVTGLTINHAATYPVAAAIKNDVNAALDAATDANGNVPRYDLSGGVVYEQANVAIGANPATSFALGLANSAIIGARNAGNTTDLGMFRLNGTNLVQVLQPFNSTVAGAVSQPAFLFTGGDYNGGTGTTTVPYMYFNAGTAPTTWSPNGTWPLGANAQSGFTGNFLDFHLNGGASVASLSYTGALTVSSCSGCGGGGGSGTVTSVSSGNLSPLFTVGVANPTVTPAFTFSLSNAAQNSVLAGPATGGSGAPSYQTAPTFSGANLTSLPVSSISTTGSSGPATLSGVGVLNIPQYSVGTTTNALTMNNSGTGATTGTTFTGASAVTLSYNTLGAAPLSSPTFTGTPAAPTAGCGSSTQLATLAYVANCAPSISGLTTGVIPQAGSATTVVNSSPQLDNGVTNANGLTYAGSAGEYAKSYNSTDTVDNAAVTFSTGSSGDSTCPAALSGTSYLCTKSSGISYSNNGAAYSPLITTASEYITSLTTTGTSGAASVSGGALNIPQYSGGGGLPTGTTGQTVYYASGGTTGTATSAIVVASASAGSQVTLNAQEYVATGGPSSLTTLNGNLTSGATSVVLTSATGYPTTGGTILVTSNGGGTNEIMSYAGVSSNTLTGVVRSLYGTAAGGTINNGNNVRLITHLIYLTTSTFPYLIGTSDGLTIVGGTTGTLNASNNFLSAGLVANNLAIGSVIFNDTSTLQTQNTTGKCFQSSGGTNNFCTDANGVTSSTDAALAVVSGTTSITPASGVVTLTGTPPTAWLTMVASTSCTITGVSCVETLINTTSGSITTSSGASSGNFAAAYTLAQNAAMQCTAYGSTRLWYCN